MGEYWGTEAGVKRADMAMQDVKLPYLAETTYNAFWHSWLTSARIKRSVFFYAGVAFNDHGNPNAYRKTIYQWSFWPCKPDGNPVTPVWGYPGFHLTNEVGEGASARTAGRYPVLPGRWYRHVMRYWSPTGTREAGEFSYGGWWMRDLEGDGNWRLLAVMRIPVPEAHFTGTGLGGFLEDFGHGGRNPRAQAYRNLYTHGDGKWVPCRFKSTPKRGEYQKVTVSRDGASAVFEICSRPFEGGEIKDKPVVVALKQAPEPPIEPFGLGEASAIRCGPYLLVSWKIPEGNAPQLRATIEVPGAEPGDKPLFAAHSDIPSVYQVFLELPPGRARQAASAKITVQSLFDQKAVRIVPVENRDPATGADPAKLASPAPGVKVQYYEQPGALAKIPAERGYANWKALPDFGKLPLSRTAFQSRPNLNLMPRKFGVVARASSFLRISRAGLYRFHFTACHGGRMKIDGRVLIEQSVNGSMNTETGWVVLKEGFHPVEMAVYCDANEDNAPRLSLEYEGLGIARTQVPESAWALPGAETVSAKVDFTASAGTGHDGNLVVFRVGGVSGDIGEVEKIEVVGDSGEIWASFQADRGTGEKSVFMPEGRHRLVPRLYLKDDTVVELKPVTVSTKNPPVSGWKLAPPGLDIQRPFGCVATPDRVVMMGDGFRWATREVRGDFTFTMRVKELINAVGGPLHTPKVSFGFYASTDPARPAGRSFHWTYSPYFKGRYETPTKNFSLKNKYWRNSLHNFSIPCRFRFSRRGSHFKGEIGDADGKKWRTLFEETAELPDKFVIGPYLNQVPTPDPEMFYRVEFDQIEIAP
jgi:hypothetical protein